MDAVLTIGEIINKTKQYFSKHDVASPRLDAEILLCHVLGKDRVQLYVHFDQPLQKREIDEYRKLVLRRAKGEPVAYLTGKKHFLNLEFVVNNNVLIPRPETELLVERAVKLLKEKAGRVLDLGTGSGAIILSILHNTPNTTGVAVDVSHGALEVANINAENQQLQSRVAFVCADMSAYLQETQEQFNLVVSNPPYVTAAEMLVLSPEVKSEPVLALAGGEDGLDFYKAIVASAKRLLLPGGVMLLEIGCLQAHAVQELARQAGFNKYGVLKDYAGLDRIVWLAGDEFIDTDKILAP